jgi:hypothetical protein
LLQLFTAIAPAFSSNGSSTSSSSSSTVAVAQTIQPKSVAGGHIHNRNQVPATSPSFSFNAGHLISAEGAQNIPPAQQSRRADSNVPTLFSTGNGKEIKVKKHALKKWEVDFAAQDTGTANP